jgi:cytoskeletal protein CcmA (bactofilin family)
MAMFAKKKEMLSDSKIATIISEGCFIEGKITADGSVRIDGEITGDVHVKQGVILGTSGKIIGNVHAAELIVFGSLQGNIQTESLEMKQTGKIIGDITTNQMSMELGAKHNGRVAMQDTGFQTTNS